VLKLYPVELWNYIKRDYLPGRNGPPKLFFATLSIPPGAFDGLSEEFTRQIRDKFEKNDRALFQYTLAASARYLILRDKGDAESVFFLTNGELSGYFPEFRRTWYIENYGEIDRYNSEELTFGGNAVVSAGQYQELCQKLALNKAFRRELKARMSLLRRDMASTIKFDMIYLPLHYVVRFSPLRFVDRPRIRTVTNYGEEIVMANSTYTDVISDTWILKSTLKVYLHWVFDAKCPVNIFLFFCERVQDTITRNVLQI
jgi:hypothetical protein